MATYISTIRFNDQGLKTVGETTRRAQAAADAAGELGASVKNIFWTLGGADGLLVFEAPDETTAAALLMKIGAAGAVHTETSRAFTTDEIEAVLAKAGLA